MNVDYQSQYAMNISLSLLSRNRNSQYELSFNSQSLFAMELLLKNGIPDVDRSI